MNATTLKKSVIGVAVLTALAIVGLTVGGGPFSVSPTDTFASVNANLILSIFANLKLTQSPLMVVSPS